jgi:hypothetical protein
LHRSQFSQIKNFMIKKYVSKNSLRTRPGSIFSKQFFKKNSYSFEMD